MDSENGITFCQDDFMSNSFDAFEEMRRKEELVDFKITFENRSVIGHRLVLAARIPHFRKLFCSCKEVTLNEIDADTLQSVINYAYSGKIEITLGNVAALLSTSKTLQLTGVYDACFDFLGSRLHSNNVLEIRRLAEEHGYSKILEVADNYIKQHFEEFMCSVSFLALPYQQLKEIVYSDDVKVSTEEKVFEAVIRWVKSSPSERKNVLPGLLSAVRMYFLTPGYLIERVSAEELVRSSLPCRDLVEEAKSYHLLPDKKSKFGLLSSEPRKFYSSLSVCLAPSSCSHPCRNLLHAVYEDGKTLYVNVFHPDSVKWLNLSTHHFSEAVDAVVPLDGVIYVFTTSVVLKFNINTLEWNSSVYCSGNGYDIFHAGSVPYNGKIYFFGGEGESSVTVHSFNPETGKLRRECSTTRPVERAGVVVVNSLIEASSMEASIYITGGKFESDVYNTVELYNPETKQWTEVSPMLYERYVHGCCDLDEKIYVCGGIGSTHVALNTAEVYDPSTNQWSAISTMTRYKFCYSASSYQEKLYAWGRISVFPVNPGTTEIYDPKINEWKAGVCIPYVHGTNGTFIVKSLVRKDTYERVLSKTRHGMPPHF